MLSISQNKLWAGLVLIVICVAGWFILSGNTIANTPPKNARIVAFGDSLINGVGATTGNNFVSQTSRALKIPIKNLGIPGNTTADGVARLGEVYAEDPGIVLVLLGGNDYLRKVPPEETWRNLDYIVKSLTDRGVVVVLLGVRGGLLRDNYEEKFEELSKKYKTAYVSDVLDGILLNKELMYDAVHPNDAGYAKIAQRVIPVLKDILDR